MRPVTFLLVLAALETVAWAQPTGTPPQPALAGAEEDDDDRAPELEVIAPAGSCPSGEAVREKLVRGPIQRHAVVEHGSPGALTARILDLEDSFDVSVDKKGSQRFFDRYRHCDERALAAAVFIAMQVEGYAGPDPAARKPPETQMKAQERRESPPPPVKNKRRPVVELNVAAQGGGAHNLSDAGPGGFGGLLVRGGLRWNAVAVRLGAALLGTSRLWFDGLDETKNSRMGGLLLPFDLAIQGALRRGRWEGTLAVGGLLLAVQAPGLANVRWGLQGGLHLDAGVRFWATETLGVSISLDADWTPAPVTVEVTDGGQRSMSQYLLRGSIGACWRFP